MIPVWAGSANSWDCDEMGHMNVRIYVEKAMEGLGCLAHAVDMSHAFRVGGPSTLIPVDQHIRFAREVHPGRPLTMQAGVLDIGEESALIYQDMRHGDGQLAASFRTRIRHCVAATGQPFPWSRRTRRALEALKITPPTDGVPRSIDPAAPCLEDSEVRRDKADALAIPIIGLGTVPAQHCDIHGRMRPEWFMGRISDAVPNLLHGWRTRVAEAAGGVRMGAAVLEYRLVYRAWPRAGDLFQVRSGLSRVAEKAHTLVHWVLDPVSGTPWMTGEAVAATFDLDARKIVPTDPALMAELETIAPRGLTL